MKEFITKVDRRVLTEDEIKMMNGIKLAYIGDAVYEVYIRTYIMNNYRASVHLLNKKAVGFVKASAQAQIVTYLKPFLNEEEWAVVMRGRNAKSATVPKNADIKEYKLATGFEALIGMLYLKHETERIQELIIKGIEYLDPGVENEQSK